MDDSERSSMSTLSNSCAIEAPHRLVIALGPEAYEASDIEFTLERTGGGRPVAARLRQ